MKRGNMFNSYDGPKHGAVNHISISRPLKQTDVAPPNYPGSYVGQTITRYTAFVSKRIGWQDKQGDWHRRVVETRGTKLIVWDGKTWVSMETYRNKK